MKPDNWTYGDPNYEYDPSLDHDEKAWLGGLGAGLVLGLLIAALVVIAIEVI